MGIQEIKTALIKQLANSLMASAVWILSKASTKPNGSSDTLAKSKSLDSLSGNGSKTGNEHPPENHLRALGSKGPPEHWLKRVRQSAPQLLDPRHHAQGPNNVQPHVTPANSLPSDGFKQEPPQTQPRQTSITTTTPTETLFRQASHQIPQKVEGYLFDPHFQAHSNTQNAPPHVTPANSQPSDGFKQEPPRTQPRQTSITTTTPTETLFRQVSHQIPLKTDGFSHQQQVEQPCMTNVWDHTIADGRDGQSQNDLSGGHTGSDLYTTQFLSDIGNPKSNSYEPNQSVDTNNYTVFGKHSLEHLSDTQTAFVSSASSVHDHSNQSFVFASDAPTVQLGEQFVRDCPTNATFPIKQPLEVSFDDENPIAQCDKTTDISQFSFSDSANLWPTLLPLSQSHEVDEAINEWRRAHRHHCLQKEQEGTWNA